MQGNPKQPTGIEHATLAVLTCICDALIESGQIKREDLANRVQLVRVAMDQGSTGGRLVEALLLSLRDEDAAAARRALLAHLTPPDTKDRH